VLTQRDADGTCQQVIGFERVNEAAVWLGIPTDGLNRYRPCQQIRDQDPQQQTDRRNGFLMVAAGS
jgi:hypothetical protein